MFPRDIVCLRNISINTLHKGDDDDDDDDDNNNNNNGLAQNRGRWWVIVKAVMNLPGFDVCANVHL